MSSVGIIVTSIGLALGFIALLVAIYFGMRSISIRVMAAQELNELPKLSDAVKSSIEAIEVVSVKATHFVEKTADLIRLDGEETRKTITDVHKSIKQELG